MEAHSADAKIEVDDLEFIVILALIHLPNMIKLAKVGQRATVTVGLRRARRTFDAAVASAAAWSSKD